MINLFYTPTFIRRYKKLPRALQGEVKEKIKQFQNKKNQPLLKVHKLSGPLENTYAFSVNYKIRIVFEYAERGRDKKTVYFLHVGSHDEVYL